MLTNILQFEDIEKLERLHMPKAFRMYFIDSNGEKVSYDLLNDNAGIEVAINKMVKGEKYRLMMYTYIDKTSESILLSIEKVVYDYQPLYQKSDVDEKEKLFMSKLKKGEEI